jgi:hypothetical protein
VEDLHGVRMVDRGGQPALALEARAEHVVLRHRWLDQLQRHVAAQRKIGGAVDHRHAAAPRHLVDAMAGERRPHL